MSINKMHSDEFHIDTQLIKKLLSKQFPQWADLEKTLMQPEGTDNAVYKLAHDKVIRLPRTARSAQTIEKEIDILQNFALKLPIAIPHVLGIGKPTADYPFAWLICSYLPGKTPDCNDKIDQQQAATYLAHFIQTMQNIDSKNGPVCNRGKSLHLKDIETRKALQLCKNFFDYPALTNIWNTALEAPKWNSNPMWIHTDLHPGNILIQDRKITGIIDFGMSGIGDPAVDLIVAWTLLTQESRDIFRSILQPDNATWHRARGWALTFGIVAYPYYKNSNPYLATIAKRTIHELLQDKK